MATMDARLKASWPLITGMLFGLVVLIGIVEDRLAARGLGMWLMVGIVVVGFAGIFIWTYFHREMPQRQQDPLPGEQQTIALTVEPQLGNFQPEQDPELYQALSDSRQTRGDVSIRLWLN
jgi:hypothetical protein